MRQYNQIAHRLVGRVAFEVLPGPGAEFDPDMEVILGTFRGNTIAYRLSELLPRPCAGILDRP
jgi:hypothetical protein